MPIGLEVNDYDSEEEIPYAIPLECEIATLIDNNYCETVTI